MTGIDAIPLPLPHMGAVNVWLLRGEPVTLVDAGPRVDGALAALDAALRGNAVRLEDVEQVLLTHHHFDHSGLAAAIRHRSGARIAAVGGVARYCARFEERALEERDFASSVMAAHGVPDGRIAHMRDFWELIVAHGASFDTDVRLADGDRIRAGGRDLRVILRPGHSTTDTLFVDDDARLAFVGDHLLETISSNTEGFPAECDAGRPWSTRWRPRPRIRYLEGLRRTAAMPLERLFTGHGPVVADHAALVRRRLADHDRRSELIVSILAGGPATAYEIGERLWPPQTVREQALLVVWEVLGHLDLLAAAGTVAEHVEGGHSAFRLTRAAVA